MHEIFGAKVMTGELELNKLLSSVTQISNERNITIQLFNAELIYGKDHIISAIDHAKRAFTQDQKISESLAMEILLYSSGEYQIKNALAKLGLKENTKKIAILFLNDIETDQDDFQSMFEDLCSEFELEPDNDVLLGDKSNLLRFGITSKELNAVPEEKWFDLVLEKVALVDIKK
jgi:KEOPS complex subunit Cgi121